eukprot:5184427-Karenia_brevis.AAC.1
MTAKTLNDAISGHANDNYKSTRVDEWQRLTQEHGCVGWACNVDERDLGMGDWIVANNCCKTVQCASVETVSSDALK